jgi:putative tryptophan/tyrosine transport system substrate-binding protein
VAPGVALAQSRLPRIGVLSPILRDQSVLVPPLLQALSDLGYREGAGMVLEYRTSDSVDSRYPAIVAELIGRKCDVIFTVTSESAARALRDARSPVPVVFIATDYDPVETGIVDSLARPAGNMTGVYAPTNALGAKRLEIAQEILPGATRFLVLSDGSTRNELAALKTVAEARRVQLTIVEFAQGPYDLAAAMESGKRAGVAGVLLLAGAGFAARRRELSAMIVRYRLPTISPGFMIAEPGMLVSYSNNIAKFTRRAAEIGVRILKGARPADIPVEQPTEYDLVVNLKTAKALGVKIPYSVLARATRLIE